MRVTVLSFAVAASLATLATMPARSASEANGKPNPAPPAAAEKACPGNPKALGVSRTVEINTAGGPGFGLEQYKAYDFLAPKEVILTFDDGPQARTTEAVLDALDAHCTKATFFSIGKMALGLPEILREVARRGHTIGSHTFTHANIRKKKTPQEAIDEIEKGVSAVHRAIGQPVAPFFRYPFLQDTPETIAHLGKRNIAIFSMDVDSFDFKYRNPDKLVSDVMAKLEKKGKGILLMHDIQPVTAKAIRPLLDQLQAAGYKIVHVKASQPATTLADYDALIEKDVKGLPGPGPERPLTSIVKTVPNDP